jgi:hypothetical protein
MLACLPLLLVDREEMDEEEGNEGVRWPKPKQRTPRKRQIVEAPPSDEAFEVTLQPITHNELLDYRYVRATTPVRHTFPSARLASL